MLKIGLPTTLCTHTVGQKRTLEASLRYLSTTDILAALKRGQSVEQFLGVCPNQVGYIRHVELRPTASGVELWVFDVEDIGNQDFLDIYDFPDLEPDGREGPAVHFEDAESALNAATATFATHPARWTNLGVAQSEYLDFICMERPAVWPTSS